MAFVLNDRVKQTSTTTGTGTFSLTGTETGFETFVTGIGDTNSTFYAIANDGTSEFEVGIGTVTDAGTDTLSRDTVISSSNSDNKVDFSAGTKTVLENFYSRVSKGGIIILDEYGKSGWGESDAVDEFFKNKKVKINSVRFSGQPTAYIIKE